MTLANLAGKKFGYLTAKDRSGSDNQGRAKWLCICDCGASHIAAGFKLTSGHTRSCGCRRGWAKLAKVEGDLTVEQLHEIVSYNPLTGIFVWNEGRKLPGEIAGRINNHGYRKLQIGSRKYKASRLAWLYIYGKWPEYQIDHINLNRSDDRIENLRECTRSQNTANTGIRGDSTSGFKGVFFRKRSKKWVARIVKDGKAKELGEFRSPEEAHQRYARAAAELFGEFARLS